MKTANLIKVMGAAAILSSAETSFGQGTLGLNNYDSGFGVFDGTSGVAAPAGTFIQVLAGATASSMSPVFDVYPFSGTSTFTILASDVNGNGPNTGSFFDGGYGHVSTVAPGGMAYVQVIAWETASSYAAAVAAGDYVGASPIWQQAVGDSPAGPRPPFPATLVMPGVINLTPATVPSSVPEPSTIALGGFSAAALLLFRRRKYSRLPVS